MTRGLTLPIVGLGFAAVKAFNEAAEATADTEAVIRSTGGAANVTKAHVLKLADAVRDYSGIEDEAVQAGQNMLLTFKGVRNEAGKNNNIFDKATHLLAGLSIKFKTDMSGAAVKLGKALNDPVKGMTALSKSGITFTDAQKKVITKLVETGDKLGAQKIILGEVRDNVGGLARAIGKTDAGKFRAAMSQAGDALETLGGIIAPVLTKFAGFIKDLADRWQKLSPHTKGMIVQFLAIAAVAGPLLFVFGKIVTGVGGLITAFRGIGLAMGVLGKLFTANPFLLLVAAIVTVVVLIVKNWDKIKEGIAKGWAAVVDFLKQVPGKILGFFAGVGSWLLETGKKLLKGLWNGIKAVAISVWNWFTSFPKKVLEGFKNAVTWLYDAGRDIIRGLWNGIRAAVGSVGSIADIIRQQIEDAKAAAGIASPSKVMFKIGRQMSQGLQLGINSLSPTMMSPSVAGLSGLRGSGVSIVVGDINVDSGEPGDIRDAVLSALSEAVGRRTGL